MSNAGKLSALSANSGNKTDPYCYGVRIYNLNLIWEMSGETALVRAISPI
jgi:hypothetical protein